MGKHLQERPWPYISLRIGVHLVVVSRRFWQNTTKITRQLASRSRSSSAQLIKAKKNLRIIAKKCKMKEAIGCRFHTKMKRLGRNSIRCSKLKGYRKVPMATT